MATPIAIGTMTAAQVSKAGADFQIVERETPEPFCRRGADQGASLWRLPQ